MGVIRSLFDFGMKRNVKQAVGFYFFYLIISAIIGGGAAIFLVPNNLQPHEEFIQGMKVGWGIGIIICSILSILILKAKKTYNAKSYAIIGLAVLGSIFIGNLVGLGFLAYMTTREASVTTTPTA